MKKAIEHYNKFILLIYRFVVFYTSPFTKYLTVRHEHINGTLKKKDLVRSKDVHDDFICAHEKTSRRLKKGVGVNVRKNCNERLRHQTLIGGLG